MVAKVMYVRVDFCVCVTINETLYLFLGYN